MIVGLTGSIGTGKSTVAAMLAQLGAKIIDFDVLAHEVIRPHLAAWEKVVAVFGRDVLRPDETVDRARLADIVFRDPALLSELNRIVHPAVFAADQAATAAILAENPRTVIVKDIPLLTAQVARQMVEKVVVVHASPDIQVTRLLGRGLAPEEAQRRIAAQVPVTEKLEFADYVIDNDGTVEETQKQVKDVYAQLAALA